MASNRTTNRKPLKVLLVEDRATDAELVLVELRRAGYEPDFVRVEREGDFNAELSKDYEIILSDFAMPQFNGLRALELLQQSGKDIPFIIISGTIGEETAVAAMRHGVADYLLKDRLTRLGSAVDGALKVSRQRRERQTMVEEIERSHQGLAAAQALSRMGSYELFLPSRHVEWSDGMFTLFGRDRSLGSPRFEEVRNWVHPEDRELFDENLELATKVTGPTMIEVRLLRNDGIFWGELRRHAKRDAQGNLIGLSGTVTDITERKLQQKAVLESEAKLRQIAETIDEVIWMSDPVAKKSLYLSPQFERIFGRSRESHEDNPNAWLTLVHPDDRERLSAAIARRELGESFSEIYRIIRPDGSIRWIRERAFPIPDADGFPYRIVGTALDVTDQKQLEDQLLRSQRLQAVGTLSSGIAHDLNNILAPILMVSSLLRPKLTDPHDAEMLGIVEQGAQRGAAIIRQLLTFSRGAAGARLQLRLETVVDEMLSLVRETFPKEINPVRQIPEPLMPVTGDPTQIHQVLMNLCVNARDAMEGRGTLTIAGENIDLSSSETKLHPHARPGAYVVISVSDTGHGMTPEVIDRIFEPFFTTKEIGKGSGLGLASVAGIVRSHLGFVTVTSEVGVGSVFKVHFPAMVRDAKHAQSEEPSAVVTGKGEVVMIVDDEAGVCTAAAGTLRKNGYRPITATDSGKALSLFLETGGAVDLLITDLMMPRMGGIALIRSMRSVHPQLKIIAMTGLDEEIAREELALMNVRHIISKPFSPSELMEMVASALNSAKPR